MNKPMKDEDFMWFMWISHVETQADARKLWLTKSYCKSLPKEDFDEFISSQYEIQGDNEYGFADLALEAMICKEDIMEKVFTVDKVRKELRKRLGRDYDVPAIKAKITKLLVDAELCEEGSDKEAILQKAYKLQDEIIGNMEDNVSWHDYFAADSLADEIRILQELYMGRLEAEEILKFLGYKEIDREIVMQEIYRVENERETRGDKGEVLK